MIDYVCCPPDEVHLCAHSGAVACSLEPSRKKTQSNAQVTQADVIKHWPNYVTEGRFSLVPEWNTQYTRVKCDGDCDFYFQDASWFVVRDTHAAHMAEELSK